MSDRHTHKPNYVTLAAHARRGLITSGVTPRRRAEVLGYAKVGGGGKYLRLFESKQWPNAWELLSWLANPSVL